MKRGWWVSMLCGAVLSLTACSGGGGGGGFGGAPASPPLPTGNVALTGNVATAAAKAGAAALAATPAATAVVLTDEAGTNTATVAAADGTFSLSVPKDHTYTLVFREGSSSGKSLGVLTTGEMGDQTTFFLAANTDLGAVTIDPTRGQATCGADLPLPKANLADTDQDGIPDVADLSANEDGDAAADADDVFPFAAGATADADSDGQPDSANATQAELEAMIAAGLTPDPDDDDDGIPNATDPAPVSTIPTEAAASPLFGAAPFSQQMLRFEEFGPEPMPAQAAGNWSALPQPQDPRSGPQAAGLEAFLAQTGVSPLPQRLSNVDLESPWKAAVKAFLRQSDPAFEFSQPVNGAGTPVGVPAPAEGRPSGEDWAHQSWDDLFPRKFYKTAVAPARDNLGLRDARQRHGYEKGEFAPGGLYHNTAGVVGTEGSCNGIGIRFHPTWPLQEPNSIWTFDGTLPPKLLQARYGEPILMRNYNVLPIDVTANNGFGRHTISTHEHNGHQPGESDGFAGAFFYPGQFYDYRWPLQLAGYSNNNNDAGAINFGATDPKAATPCEPGETFPVLVDGVATPKTCVENPATPGHGTVQIPGDWRETMSTHWFHDHMLDHTAENVYKGNATMMNYYSALDRGNEAVNDGVNLRFPSGTALSWGNRDYDVNLVLADKAFDQNGQLWFNTEQHNGFLGDVMTVNFLYKPYFDVRARRYRFRILNGSVSRIMALALVRERSDALGELPGPGGSGKSYDRVPFHMIANDGNVMEHAVPFDGTRDHGWGLSAQEWKGQLPSQTIAERYDIVVDFSKNGIGAGDKLYFVNVMEHDDGKGTKSKVSLANILNGSYNPVVQNGAWVGGDPCVGKFLELRVHAYAGTDLSMNPADYEPGKAKMIPLTIDRAAKTVNGIPLSQARHHTFEFRRSQAQGGHGTPWAIRVDGGTEDRADPQRISTIEHGDLEIWTIKTGRGWTHPVHIHFEEGIILTRGGKEPPEWEKWARKDMYRIGPEDDSTGEVEIAFRARDFLGHYVQHCHNTMHEDHAMLLRWDARHKNAVLIDTPLPTYDGVFFGPSFSLPSADSGDGTGPKGNLP